MRLNLIVPFLEYEIVKGLGAKWDSGQKIWFLEKDRNLNSFAKWLPDNVIQSNNYSIIETGECCWKCGEITKVYGFLLSGFSEWDLNSYEEEMEINLDFTYFNNIITVYYITDLSPTVLSEIKRTSSNYYFDYSKATDSRYWMNHCEYCHAKQGDFMLFSEPGGAFYPTSWKNSLDIKLTSYSEPFICSGGTSHGRSCEFF